MSIFLLQKSQRTGAVCNTARLWHDGQDELFFPRRGRCHAPLVLDVDFAAFLVVHLCTKCDSLLV